jgi:dephospho-CoA kinase
MTDRRRIGITGGIGSGKSRVSDYFAEICRLPIISLDLVCRDLLEPDNTGWLSLRGLLGNSFFDSSGVLDRAALRRELFADTALRGQVDALLHPLAREEMHSRVAEIDGPVLIEIPLLYEAGWQDDVDVVVVVLADSEMCCKRIMERDRVSLDEARKAVAAQMSPEEKARRADHVIDNSGSWNTTCRQVEALADLLGLQFFLPEH